MDAKQLQLQLFGSSTSSSVTDVPSSLRSSELATSSLAPIAIPIVATATIPTARALVRRTLDGAGSAETRSCAVKSTAVSAQLPMLSISTERRTEETMLGVPRPTTRAECLEEARPCPWVSCRHHLLLEVAEPKAQRKRKPTSLVLCGPGTHGGTKRRGLSSSAGAAEVEIWMDEAVERLSRMEHTCALDAVDVHGEYVVQSDYKVGRLLGTTRVEVDRRTKQAHQSSRMARRRMRTTIELEMGDDMGDDDDE